MLVEEDDILCISISSPYMTSRWLRTFRVCLSSVVSTCSKNELVIAARAKSATEAAVMTDPSTMYMLQLKPPLNEHMP